MEWRGYLKLAVYILIYFASIVLCCDTATQAQIGWTDVPKASFPNTWWFEALPFTIATACAFLIGRELRNIARPRTRVCLLLGVWIPVSLFLTFQPVVYSKDIFRYLWDGQLTLHGMNPFLYVPNDPHLVGYRDFPYWPVMDWKAWADGYAPFAQILFAVVSILGHGFVRGYKLWMWVNDGVTLFLLYRLLKLHHNPIGHSDRIFTQFAWFALFPPFLFESLVSAHVDGLVIPWLILAWIGSLRDKPGFAGAMLGLATAIKIYPAVLLAAWIRSRQTQFNIRLFVGFGLAVLCSFIPFLHAGHLLFAYLHDTTQLNYNSSIQRLLLNQFGATSAHFSTLLLALVECLAWFLVLFTPARAASLPQKACWLGLTFMLFSPVVHQWYLLWLLPFAIVALDFATLWWMFSLHLIYDNVPFEMYFEYVPTYFGFLRSWVRTYRQYGKVTGG